MHIDPLPINLGDPDRHGAVVGYMRGGEDAFPLQVVGCAPDHRAEIKFIFHGGLDNSVGAEVDRCD
jgi:hypothetical protein